MSSVHRAYVRDVSVLRDRLRNAGLSDTQASLRADLPATAIADLLTRRRACCAVSDALAIADVLSCRFEDLFASL